MAKAIAGFAGFAGAAPQHDDITSLVIKRVGQEARTGAAEWLGVEKSPGQGLKTHGKGLKARAI